MRVAANVSQQIQRFELSREHQTDVDEIAWERQVVQIPTFNSISDMSAPTPPKKPSCVEAGNERLMSR
jgi:hypothetical protein